MFNWNWGKSSSNKVSSEVAQSTQIEESPELHKQITEAKKVYNGAAPKERHDQIVYAFTSGGVDYYKFSAEVNIPFQRAAAARDIFTEEMWQISPDYLKGWNTALIELITSDGKKPEKKLYEIGILASRLQEQIGMSYSFVRQMKLASVLYFDEVENPLDYQYPYNEAKIKRWTENNDVAGFFLNLPDNYFLPSSIELQQNIVTYLQAETTAAMNDLKHIITLTQLENTDEDLKKRILSQMEMLKNLNLWSKGQSTSTT